MVKCYGGFIRTHYAEDWFYKTLLAERSIRLDWALVSIPPTSVEPERSFSSAGLLCTKIRSRLSDEALDDLVYGKSHMLDKFRE